MILSNKNNRFFLFLIFLLQFDLCCNNSHTPIVVVNGSQKTWCDYGFIIATIGSIGFIGRYLWRQNKENNENNILLQNIKTQTASNKATINSLAKQIKESEILVQKIIIEHKNLKKKLPVLSKNIGINTEISKLLYKELNRLKKQHELAFKNVKTELEAIAKRDQEILALLSKQNSSAEGSSIAVEAIASHTSSASPRYLLAAIKQQQFSTSYPKNYYYKQ